MTHFDEDALPTLEGRALAFGLTLTAPQILDPMHAALSPEEARRHLFAALDPTLANRLQPTDIVVAAEVRGTDAFAHHVVATLATAGIVALVAERFAPVILAGAVAAGVVAITTDTPSFLRTNDRVRLDLDAGKIVNLSSGDRAAIRNASAPRDRAMLRATLARTIVQ